MSRLIGVSNLPSPPVITIASRCASLGGTGPRWGSAVPSSGLSPWSDAADCLLAFPFVIESQTTFYKGFWVMGSAGGTVNREVGIWDDAYNKIITTGAVAGANTNSVPQSAAFTATVTLPPGLYYAGMAYNATTTNTHFRFAASVIAVWQAMGCWRQAAITLGSLAATATPGDMSNVAFPLFGLITRSAYDV